MSDPREDLIDRKRMCYNGWFYSAQRIDLLVVAICGAGLYVILETLKSSLDKQIGHVFLLKIAGVFFVFAIIVNFISQFTGKDANYHDMQHCNKQLCADNPVTPEQQELIKHHNDKAEKLTRWTNSCNLASMICMFIALLVQIVFFLITF